MMNLTQFFGSWVLLRYLLLRYDHLNSEVRPNPNIPDTLLFAEVLPRLPFKSLMQFKSVSKQWKTMISSSNFAKLMLQISNSEPHNHGVLVQPDFPSFYAVPNYACFDGNPDFNFGLQNASIRHLCFGNSLFDLVDSSNGLVCLRSNENNKPLYVWNPITNQCRKILRFDQKYKVLSPSLWAFGYAPSLGDYKIVNTGFLFNAITRKCATRTWVFSLRKGVWKQFETAEPLKMYFKTCNNAGVVLSNGKCHWLLIKRADANAVLSSAHIVAFDLLTETFSVIMLPQDLDDNERRENACVGNIEEDLCVASQGLGRCLEVWVMEQYEEESWTKLLKVSSLTSPVTGHFKFCTLRTDGRSGKLLMHLNNQVLVCIWKDSGSEFHWIDATTYGSTYHARRYVQSLISPFMEEVDEDQY